MRPDTETRRFTLGALLAAALALSAGQALAQAAAGDSQAQARAILARMAELLSGAQSFSVNVRVGYDVVQRSGQKIEFGEARKVTLSRPDRLRIEGERSDGAKSLTVFTGREIVLVDTAANVYATAAQPGGIDQAVVHFVRDLGMRLPLAVLLVSQLPAEMRERVRSIDYVEKTGLHGIASHHLAARTDTVDFQVWVADGDRPLPQRVVISYRKAKGEPQFWAQFSDWNLAPTLTESTFTATPPAGAQKVAFAAQLPRVSPGARKTSADKGGKR
jgi:hypothetical protein